MVNKAVLGSCALVRLFRTTCSTTVRSVECRFKPYFRSNKPNIDRLSASPGAWRCVSEPNVAQLSAKLSLDHCPLRLVSGFNHVSALLKLEKRKRTIYPQRGLGFILFIHFQYKCLEFLMLYMEDKFYV